MRRRRCSAVDDAIERIVDQLQASGELERTVIMFMTDNGFAFGQHRIRGKRCQYDECIRTPFAARVPGVQAHDVPGLISNVDLAPTIADLAGVEPGQPVDGRASRRRCSANRGTRLPASSWIGRETVRSLRGKAFGRRTSRTSRARTARSSCTT